MRTCRPLTTMLFCTLLATGCTFPGQPDPNDRPVPANEVTDFTILFEKNCTGCHGEDGTFGPAPPLKDDLFRAIVPKEAVIKVLKNGRHGTSMPSFAKEKGGGLTDTQITILALQIKGLPYSVNQADNEKLLTVEPDNAGIKPVWGVPPESKNAPTYFVERDEADAGDVNAGANLFARACSSCHGKNGKADGLTINDSTLLALMSKQALRRIIITGRPDLGMPSYAGKTKRPDDFQPLTSEDVSNLVAFVSSWNRDDDDDK